VFSRNISSEAEPYFIENQFNPKKSGVNKRKKPVCG
jgi:hypothetical protein